MNLRFAAQRCACADTRHRDRRDIPGSARRRPAGERGAFSALWRDANPALLRYLRVIAPEVAEDVAADTWVHVVRGLARFRGDESAWRAWLFTTARRRAIDHGRYRAPPPVVQVAEIPPGTQKASPNTPIWCWTG